MNLLKVKIKKLNDNAITPAYGTDFSAGADLYAADEKTVILPGQTAKISTGIQLEIPEGYVGLIYARSGMAVKRNLAPANKVGVIDSDYRGEIIVALYNHGDKPETVTQGERVAQIVFTPYFKAEFTSDGELEGTARGEGGFGSTGA